MDSTDDTRDTMHTTDVQAWGESEDLSPDILYALQDNGFNCLDDLKEMGLSDIKECFLKEGLLNLQQCLALRNALHRFHAAAGSGVAETPAREDNEAATSGALTQSSGEEPEEDTSCSGACSEVAVCPRVLDSTLRSFQLSPPVTGGSDLMTFDTRDDEEEGGFAMVADDTTAAGGHFRFLLLGKTGSGKSTTGNTIFGEDLFSTDATFSSVTADCERQTCYRGGHKIEIIDSPGLYDTHKTQEEICVTIVQAVAGMHPGPHAILYVVRLGRYTAEEHGAYKRLKALFDGDITKYMIILFTHGDMLERKNRSIEDLISENTPKELQEVLRECSNRYVVFNNFAADPDPQVNHLLEKVRQLERENNSKPYSCPKYSKIGEGMEEEVARRIQEVEKRDLERQKYVQQLERQAKAAEKEATRTREEFQKNEEERRRKLAEEEEKRKALEEKLLTQAVENQRQIQQHQDLLEKARKEREEQERMLREKDHEMTEERRKIEKENAQAMKKKEEEMTTKIKEMEGYMERQKRDRRKELHRFENEKQDLALQLETQRQRELQEIASKQAEMERLKKEKEKETREAMMERRRRHREEMERLKQDVVDKTDYNALDMLVDGVATVFKGLSKWISSLCD